VTAEHDLELADSEAVFQRVAAHVSEGARFAGLFAAAQDGETRLRYVLAQDGSLLCEDIVLPPDASGYMTATSEIPAAAWYEREIHDLFGLVAIDHPRLDPLVLPLHPGAPRPRPGSWQHVGPVDLDTRALPVHLQGEGVFTIPYGPVRSGVFESIEYLVETPGEDIPHLRTRVFHKHRGVEIRFEAMSTDDGVLMAERTEGVASVAHAIAYCQAIERIAEVEVSAEAGVVRVIHAELERIANHLDSTIRHTEAAGQVVAYARLSLHKERVQRLRARLCGSRFGRGVVVPGGVSGPPRLGSSEIFGAIDEIEGAVRADLRLLLNTPSFVDRLRGTGVIPPAAAHSFALLGPLARASGQMEDVRFARPYAAYGQLGHQLLDTKDEGDALTRQRVRNEEIYGSFHLIRQAIDRLSAHGVVWSRTIGPCSGEAIGWAEAPQGEVLYLVSVDGGRLVRVKPRSASFHNLGFFHAAFPKDILTDFAFIEASFGVSIAGVAS